MKTVFSSEVEGGRITTGSLRSGPGERNGAFEIRHPASGQKFGFIISDDRDWKACNLSGHPWDHVSVSCTTKKRLPTWTEMCWAKTLFFDDEETVVQFHPPKSKYVNDNPMVLHLWRFGGGETLLPPGKCV